MKAYKAYKLCKLRKDGSVGPLFIKKSLRIPFGEWIEAGDHPTNGFAHRPGWHCSWDMTTHLKLTPDRVWVEVEIEDWEEFQWRKSTWVLAKRVKFVRRHFSPDNLDYTTHFINKYWERHSELVDKKFSEGLTEEEQGELTQVAQLLDDCVSLLYHPIIHKILMNEKAFRKIELNFCRESPKRRPT